VRVIILGGGVIGVTSAWWLAQAGHEVVVIDRQQGAALETSFANAGEVSPGYSTPWAGPHVPVKAIKWMLMKHGPLVVRPKLDYAMWRWIAQMLRNCTEKRYLLNKSRMVRLAEYSRDVLVQLRADTGITYDDRAQGTLQLFRTQAQLDDIGDDVAVLKEGGVPFEVLDAAGCIRAEPALARVQGRYVGGLRLPGDETGDCHIFTQKLATMAAGKGVQFRYGTKIEGIETEAGRVVGVRTPQERVSGDAYLVALGSYSPQILRRHGIDLPVYPVKGYSITVPITDPAGAPESTVMDETYKVAITRLGDRIRVGGTAEVAGFDLMLRQSRQETLINSVSDMFPDGGDYRNAKFWCGLRPMTPDGPPVIGKARYENLWLNTGHGTLGWTMACGSARVIADQISGRRPDIDTADLALSRYA
jgi:D-amino-acid dehydrogenase